MVSFMAGSFISTADLRIVVERAVNDVGPLDQFRHRRGIETEALLRTAAMNLVQER